MTYAYRMGAGVREKRRTKEMQEQFGPLFSPYLEKLAALEARVAALESEVTSDESIKKRGPGRPPKEGA
jgi:hypothetical protein